MSLFKGKEILKKQLKQTKSVNGQPLSHRIKSFLTKSLIVASLITTFPALSKSQEKEKSSSQNKAIPGEVKHTSSDSTIYINLPRDKGSYYLDDIDQYDTVRININIDKKQDAFVPFFPNQSFPYQLFQSLPKNFNANDILNNFNQPKQFAYQLFYKLHNYDLVKDHIISHYNKVNHLDTGSFNGVLGAYTPNTLFLLGMSGAVSFESIPINDNHTLQFYLKVFTLNFPVTVFKYSINRSPTESIVSISSHETQVIRYGVGVGATIKSDTYVYDFYGSRYFLYSPVLDFKSFFGKQEGYTLRFNVYNSKNFLYLYLNSSSFYGFTGSDSLHIKSLSSLNISGGYTYTFDLGHSLYTSVGPTLSILYRYYSPINSLIGEKTLHQCVGANICFGYPNKNISFNPEISIGGKNNQLFSLSLSSNFALSLGDFTLVLSPVIKLSNVKSLTYDKSQVVQTYKQVGLIIKLDY